MGTPLNLSAYEQHLTEARLRLSVIDFDPGAHPRDWRGRFKKALTGMKRGDVRSLPSGVTIEKKYANYKVTSPDGQSISPKTLDETVTQAMRYDAQSTHPASIGGAKSTTVSEATKVGEGAIDPETARSAFDKLGLDHGHLLDNQLPSARRHILDIVDPAGQPPAKDGAEAAKRLTAASPVSLGRGRSSTSIHHPDWAGDNWHDRAWDAVNALRGTNQGTGTISHLQTLVPSHVATITQRGGAFEIKQFGNDSEDPLRRSFEPWTVRPGYNGVGWTIQEPSGEYVGAVYDEYDEGSEPTRFASPEAAVKHIVSEITASTVKQRSASLRARGTAMKAHNERLHRGGY